MNHEVGLERPFLADLTVPKSGHATSPVDPLRTRCFGWQPPAPRWGLCFWVNAADSHRDAPGWVATVAHASVDQVAFGAAGDRWPIGAAVHIRTEDQLGRRTNFAQGVAKNTHSITGREQAAVTFSGRWLRLAAGDDLPRGCILKP